LPGNFCLILARVDFLHAYVRVIALKNYKMNLDRRGSSGIDGELDPTRVVNVIVSPYGVPVDDGASNIMVGTDGGFYKVVAYDDDDRISLSGCKRTSVIQTYVDGRIRKLHIEQ